MTDQTSQRVAGERSASAESTGRPVSRRTFIKVGVVGDQKWEEWGARLSRVFTGANVRFFDPSQLADAREWIVEGWE